MYLLVMGIGGPQRPERGAESPGAGVTQGDGMARVGAGDRILVL